MQPRYTKPDEAGFGTRCDFGLNEKMSSHPTMFLGGSIKRLGVYLVSMFLGHHGESKERSDLKRHELRTIIAAL